MLSDLEGPFAEAKNLPITASSAALPSSVLVLTLAGRRARVAFFFRFAPLRRPAFFRPAFLRPRFFPDPAAAVRASSTSANAD